MSGELVWHVCEPCHQTIGATPGPALDLWDHQHAQHRHGDN